MRLYLEFKLDNHMQSIGPCFMYCELYAYWLMLKRDKHASITPIGMDILIVKHKFGNDSFIM